MWVGVSTGIPETKLPNLPGLAILAANIRKWQIQFHEGPPCLVTCPGMRCRSLALQTQSAP